MAKTRYTPEKFNVITSEDDIGAILDVSRILGEDLPSYKNRILESSEKLANSTYEGLINGINRELGLERRKLLSIDLKSLLLGSLADPAITYAADTITDNRNWSGTIDGVNINVIGGTLTSLVNTWVVNELTGLTLTIDAVDYKILSNTSDTVTFDGDLSSTAGLPYSIQAKFGNNTLVGLALCVGQRKYEILENNNNSIRAERDIENKFGLEYKVTALRPRVHVTASRMILYKEYLNEDNFQLDIEIPIRERGNLHKSLVAEIKEKSLFFISEDMVPLEDESPVFTIKQQDSDVIVVGEEVPGSKFFRLENKDIKNGTIKFSEQDVFFREVDNLETSGNGPFFFLDHKEGIVRSKNVPNGTGVVSYTYSDLPIEIEAAPAVITPLADEEAELFLFAQKDKILFDDVRDKQISSQPKSKMIEYIAELLKVKEQAWGK